MCNTIFSFPFFSIFSFFFPIAYIILTLIEENYYEVFNFLYTYLQSHLAYISSINLFYHLLHFHLRPILYSTCYLLYFPKYLKIVPLFFIPKYLDIIQQYTENLYFNFCLEYYSLNAKCFIFQTFKSFSHMQI